MSDSQNNTAFRTYPFGARGRQLIDSASILMPNISKAKLVNAAIFHMVYDMDGAMKDGRAPNIKAAYEVVMEPILSIAYEDLLRVVSPTTKNQTPLDDYIGIRVTRVNRDGTPVPEFVDNAGLLSEGEDEDDSLLGLLDEDEEDLSENDVSDPGDGPSEEGCRWATPFPRHTT